MMPFPSRVFESAVVAAGDPHWNKTVLLTGFDATVGNLQWADESFAANGNSVDLTGSDPLLETTIKKFGAGSANFDGSNDHVNWATDTDWQFGAGEFTIEAWVRFKSVAGNQVIASFYHTSSNRSWWLRYTGTALEFVGSSNGTSGAVIVTGAWSPSIDTWYHAVVDRSGNVFRVYVDGTMLASATNTITLFASTTNLRIGNAYSAGETFFFNGYMDELRITKGAARYASDAGYAVPTAAFPRS